MEITESTIYWVTRLDAINIVAGVGLGIILLAVGLWLLISFADDELDAVKKHGWKALPIIGLLLIILIFIPTTKEMCAIKVLPLIVNDETVQEIPKDIAELAHEWLEELKPKKED